jgi:hemolysin activation/secretion protein
VYKSATPYQLLLGDRRGGVRGYEGSRVAGATRVVVRAESRWRWKGIRQWIGTGGALFADAGKMWAGDAPYGRTTGIRASVGASLLAAVPRQSRRLARLDLAVPITRDRDAGRIEFGFTLSKAGQSFWRDPADVRRARATTPSTSIFGWP